MAMTESKLLDSDPLDRLPALVNGVLIQIGRVFRDPSLRDPKLSPLDVKAKNQRIIPQANSDFHDILDDLEIEIENAKAVFERDLALIRAKRAERERAAGISRLRPTEEEKATNRGLTSPVAPVAARMRGNTNQDPMDIDMPDAAPYADEEASTSGFPEVTNSEALLQSAQNDTNSTYSPQPTTANLAIPVQPSADINDPTTTRSSAPAPITTTAPPVSTSLPPTPLSATFASMFPDPTPNDPFGSTDQVDFDFDIDFSNIADGNSTGADLDLSALNASTAPQMDLTATAAAPVADGENGAAEDINSLLPGLENFVNSGADFDMLELGNGTDTATGNVPSADHNMPALNNAFSGPENSANGILPTVTTGEVDKAMEAIPVGESSFNELFFANDANIDFGAGLEDTNDSNGGDGNGNDDMVDFEGVSDFDENWFN